MNRKQSFSLFDSKIFWMAVSLLLSLVIWIYVVSTENAVVTQVFRGVKVEVIGEDVLQNSRNLIVTDMDTSTVRVEIRGPRRIVDALDSDDLQAQIDVSKLSRAAYASMKYKIVYPNGTETRNLSEVSYSPETVNFMVSTLNSVSVPVRGGYDGTLEEGYTAESPVFEPSSVTVTGPDAYLKEVSYAWVSFGAGKVASSSYTEEAPVTLMNSAGQPVSMDYLTVSEKTVSAVLPILEVKDIPLSVELIEGAGATKANTKVTITPDRITLAGDSAILSGMNRIILSTVDLTDFKTGFSDTFVIPFDNSLKNVSGETEAKVDIEITGLSTKTFTVKNISYINAPENLTVELLTKSLDVTIRGTEEQLNQLSADSIRAVADLTDFKESTGSYMPVTKIYIDGSAELGAIGDYPVSIKLS